MTALEVCRESLDYAIAQGWIGKYERTGRFRQRGRDTPGVPKELDKLLWYARLDGALYRDVKAWRAAWRLVDSFRHGQSAKLGSVMTVRDAFGDIRAPLRDVHRFLSTAFAAIDFKMLASDVAAQSALFVCEQSARVEDLPEPYGKYQQLRLEKPKWDSPANLRIEVKCTLSTRGTDACAVDVQLSTFAPSALSHLACEIGQFTGQAALAPPQLSAGLASPLLAWLIRDR